MGTGLVVGLAKCARAGAFPNHITPLESGSSEMVKSGEAFFLRISFT
jgi:hypothetical protein